MGRRVVLVGPVADGLDDLALERLVDEQDQRVVDGVLGANERLVLGDDLAHRGGHPIQVVVAEAVSYTHLDVYKRQVLVCADDAKAKEATMALVEAIEGLRPLDAGRLSQAQAIEAFTAVCIAVNIRYKARTYIRMGGI